MCRMITLTYWEIIIIIYMKAILWVIVNSWNCRREVKLTMSIALIWSFDHKLLCHCQLVKIKVLLLQFFENFFSRPTFIEILGTDGRLALRVHVTLKKVGKGMIIKFMTPYKNLLLKYNVTVSGLGSMVDARPSTPRCCLTGLSFPVKLVRF